MIKPGIVSLVLAEDMPNGSQKLPRNGDNRFFAAPSRFKGLIFAFGFHMLVRLADGKGNTFSWLVGDFRRKEWS